MDALSWYRMVIHGYAPVRACLQRVAMKTVPNIWSLHFRGMPVALLCSSPADQEAMDDPIARDPFFIIPNTPKWGQVKPGYAPPPTARCCVMWYSGPDL